jgi:hypothetical protein
MKAHRSLRNVVLLPFLALVTLSAAAAASPGLGIGSHVQLGAHQAAGRWMHAGPWMYGKAINRGPWMYAVINGRPGCGHAGQVTRDGPISA